LSENTVTINGFISKRFEKFIAEVYDGRVVLGSSSGVSASNGSFNLIIRTKSRAGMRPDVKIYCLR
jgi:hypothetical protein